jgi:hypothetical protein
VIVLNEAFQIEPQPFTLKQQAIARSLCRPIRQRKASRYYGFEPIRRWNLDGSPLASAHRRRAHHAAGESPVRRSCRHHGDDDKDRGCDEGESSEVDIQEEIEFALIR